jgi:hypothetical protein
MDVSSILFTQSTVLPKFGDGGSVHSAALGLREGQLKTTDFPCIRVVEVDGKFFSLDNRRLFVFKEGLKYQRGDNRHVQVQIVHLDDLSASKQSRCGFVCLSVRALCSRTVAVGTPLTPDQRSFSLPHHSYPGLTIRDELFGNHAKGFEHKKLTTREGRCIHVKDGVANWSVRLGPKGGKFVYDRFHRKVRAAAAWWWQW